MTGIFLGWRFIARRPVASLMSMLAIAGCILPILVVWGLKSGYVDTLINQLRSDPTHLEIRLRGDRPLTGADIEHIRSLSGAGYVEPTTRGLSMRVFVLDAAGDRRQDGSLIPSTAGDPLLGDDAAPQPGNAILSAALASRLGVEPGGTIRVVTGRSDGSERFDTRLVVVAVLPAARLSGNRLVVPPQLILALEDFVDGYAVPEFGISGRPRPDTERVYASARIYAAGLESVDPVGKTLEQEGYFVDTDASAVSFVLALDRAAAVLVVLFGSVLAFGAAVALWSSLNLGFLPQRRHLALLVLMGGTRFDLAGYILIQAGLVGGAAIGVSLAGFGTASAVVNQLFRSSTAEWVCSLTGGQMAIASALAGLVVLAIGAGFVISCWSIEATGALRDES